MEEWLQGLYASQKKSLGNHKIARDDVPSYEKNKATTEILNNLKDANQAADLQSEEEVRLMKILIEEQVAESKFIIYLKSLVFTIFQCLNESLQYVIGFKLPD